METSNRFECIKHASIHPNIQDGDCGSHQELHSQRGKASLFKPHRCMLPHSHSSKVAKIFHVGGRSFQFRCLPFSLAMAPLEFTCIAKEVKLMLIDRGIHIH